MSARVGLSALLAAVQSIRKATPMSISEKFTGGNICGCNPAGTGNPEKLSRATIFATSNWAQAMIGHLWTGPGMVLFLDPAGGINENGQLITTQYNDFVHLQWLGSKPGITPIFSTALSDQWQCIEAHIKLNTPGASDGIFEFWINGNLESNQNNLNWVGTWQE
jgi:hypothetical protein